MNIDGIGPVKADASWAILGNGRVYLGETQILNITPMIKSLNSIISRRPFTLNDGKLLTLALGKKLEKELEGIVQ